MPVKGQLVSIQMKSQILRRVTRAGSIYICPKAGNRLIVGASEEPGVDNLDVQVATISALLDQAKAVVPELDQGKIVTSWAGLRPATPDRLPIIGRSHKVEHVFLCNRPLSSWHFARPPDGRYNSSDDQGTDSPGLCARIFK